MKEKNKETIIDQWISLFNDEIKTQIAQKGINTELKLTVFSCIEEKLNFLKEKKLELNQHMDNIPEQLSFPAFKYFNFLNTDSYDTVLREKAIIIFLNTYILNGKNFDYNTENEKLITFNLFRRDKIINKYIEIICALEYSYYLDIKINKIKQENFNQLDSDTNDNKLEWNGTQTELIELIKALIENGNIKGVQKDIINNFTDFFGIEIKNPHKLIQDLKKRNIQSETLFLDKLKSKLYAYIKKVRISNPR